MHETLEIYTIYHNPSDYPGKWVVRTFSVVAGEQNPVANSYPHSVTDSLNQARASLPQGLTCINRMPGDDPVIFESWI